MNESCAFIDNNTLEIDLERFTALYAQAVKGDLSHDQEDDVVDIASVAMNSPDLDEQTREMFQSAFFVLSKKNKKFIDLKGLRNFRRHST